MTPPSVKRDKLDVLAAVCQENPDPLAPPGATDNPAVQESQESPDSPVAHQRSASPPSTRHADPAHQDPQDPPDLPDQPASPDAPDPTADPETPEVLELLDHRDLPVALDAQAPMAALEAPDVPRKALLPPQEIQAVLANPDPRVFPETQEPLDAQEELAELDPRDPLELQEPQETAATTDSPETPDGQDPKEKEESARNTAPSTAEFSSKTEPGVKRRRSGVWTTPFHISTEFHSLSLVAFVSAFINSQKPLP